MNTIYTVVAEGDVLFPTTLPDVTCFSCITVICHVWL